MSIAIYSGKPGSGKSLKLADTIGSLLARNEKWHLKIAMTSDVVPPKRQIVSNIKLSKDIEDLYPGFIKYWSDPVELITMRDCDIIWDEIATHLDSTQWQNVPLDLKRFLQQHRKRGIDIYGSTQAFAMVDISMRRLVDELSICSKLFGSPNPSATRPEVKSIWGMIWISHVDPLTFEDEKPKRVGWDWLWISQKLVQVYDTRQEITMGQYPPLKHIERSCIDPNCDFHRVIHT